MAPRTVLIVEDDPLIRTDAATLLQDAGMDIVEVETGDSALAYVWEQAASIRAVFADVRTPGDTDGLDLAHYIASNWPHITVLLTSGRTDPGRDLPANIKFLTKPWPPAKVLDTLQPSTAAA